MKALLKTTVPKHLSMNSNRMVILVSENLTGHRAHYLEALAESLAQSGYTLLVVLQSAVDFELDAHQKTAIAEIDFFYVDNFGDKSEIINFLGHISALHEYPRIMFWDADNWIKFLLFFRGEVHLLFMRPYLTSKKILNVIKYSFKWLAILYFHLVRKFKIGILGVPFHKPKIFPSLWFDDPLLTKPNEAKLGGDQSLLRQSFGIGTDSRIILVPGFLTSRKNPELAISILDHVSKHSFDSFCLVFAGKSERTCKLQISNACHPNVFHLDKYLSDSEYRTLLNISSIVLLPYSNRGSSSIVLESLAHGKNVIITKSKIWLNAERNSQGLLHLCPLNAVSISKAIQKILQCDNSTTPVILSGQIRANIIDFLSKELF